MVADLSNIYLDVCKDKLYCDGKNSVERRASQSAMAMITMSLIGTLAPILTYTMDELLSFAPEFIKNGAVDIFDYKKYVLPSLSSDINEDILFEAKEKFNESIENLKKDKIIKSALELEIYTDSADILALPQIEAEDLFLVSCVLSKPLATPLVSFKVGESSFEVYKATKNKCPRCWKFSSEKEDCLCDRCHKVVNI